MTEHLSVAKNSYVSSGVSSYASKGDPGRVLLQLIDQVELLVGAAARIPGTNRILADRREMLDLVDQLRVAVPDEVQEARDILLERDDLLTRARREAEQAAVRARQQVEKSINESEMVEAAKERARQIIAIAVKEAAQTRSEADAYALEVLQRLEEELAGNLGTVRGGIRALREDLQLNELRFPETPSSDRK